jgi:hypothetical protein
MLGSSCGTKYQTALVNADSEMCGASTRHAISIERDLDVLGNVGKPLPFKNRLKYERGTNDKFLIVCGFEVLTINGLG